MDSNGQLYSCWRSVLYRTRIQSLFSMAECRSLRSSFDAPTNQIDCTSLTVPADACWMKPRLESPEATSMLHFQHNPAAFWSSSKQRCNPWQPTVNPKKGSISRPVQYCGPVSCKINVCVKSQECFWYFCWCEFHSCSFRGTKPSQCGCFWALGPRTTTSYRVNFRNPMVWRVGFGKRYQSRYGKRWLQWGDGE